jgi:hypothetical protein
MDRGHRVRRGKNLCSSKIGPVAGSCEYRNSPSGFIKVGGFLDKLGNLPLHTKASAFTPPQATMACGGRIIPTQSISQHYEQVGCGSVNKNLRPCRN